MALFSAYLALTGIVYLVLRSIYRLWFHPLSKFPGPKLAAISHLYEFYYDTIKGGMYIWEVERMHEKYGNYLSRIVLFQVDEARPYCTIQSSGASRQGSLLLRRDLRWKYSKAREGL